MPSHRESHKATFGLGWFWHPEASFGRLSGVTKTSVGYTGGKLPFPTYKIMGDHTEAVRVYFNPEVISYTELLNHFWKSHCPTVRSSAQYRSAIWCHSEAQLVEVRSIFFTLLCPFPPNRYMKGSSIKSCLRTRTPLSGYHNYCDGLQVLFGGGLPPKIYRQTEGWYHSRRELLHFVTSWGS